MALNLNSTYRTEEDVRTKIVYEKLRELNIPKEQILLEHAARIRLGRKIYDKGVLRGRCDILVKNHQGYNLITIEVKNTGVSLTIETINQAISYSRAIEGNIAPITIITNGKETLFYDSITSQPIEKENLTTLGIEGIIDLNKSNSSYNNLKKEALNKIFSHSPEIATPALNQLYQEQMSIIEGDIIDRKKYCEKLYHQVTNDIDLDSHSNGFFLVTGKPQSGKTNFLCHTSNRIISHNYICIFFPAYKIIGSIHETISKFIHERTDLELKNTNTLIKNLASSNKVFIVIDSLHEVNKETRDIIIDELNYYHSQGVKVIISYTDYFEKDIQQDSGGNLHKIFEINHCDKLIEPKKIQIKKPSDNLLSKISSSYSKAYNVRFNIEPNKIKSLYHLRIISEFLSDNPRSVDYNNIELKWLKAKAENVRKSINKNCYQILKELSIMMLNSKSPVTESQYSMLAYGTKFELLDDELISQGILTKSDDKIYFYYDSFRDLLLIEHYFNQNNTLEDNLDQFIENAENEITNSIVYKYFTESDIAFHDIMSMRDELYPKITNALLGYIEVNNYPEHQVAFVLKLCMNKLKNVKFYIFIDDVFAWLLNNSHSYDLYSYSNEIITLLGHYLKNHDIESTYYRIDSDTLDIIPLNSFFTTVEYAIGHTAITYLTCNQPFSNYTKDYAFISDKLKHLSNKNSFDDFFASLIDHHLNHTSMYCSAPSYLEVLVDDYKFNSNQICDVLDDIKTLNNMMNGHKTLVSLINQFESKIKIK